MKAQTEKPDFSVILKEAVEKPGRLSKAYRAFSSYSFGNMLLIWSQCEARKVEVAPIATYKQWNEKGRQVRKGAKALALCVPSAFKEKVENKETGETEEKTRAFFTFRRSWFLLTDTDGPDAFDQIQEIKAFNAEKCLETLKIKRETFQCPNGNAQGYAKHGERTLAINPVATDPFKTLIHEIAHIELGHTDQTLHDDQSLPRDIKEVEAECVALLIIESLGLKGSEDSRGYIQHWNRGSKPIDEKTAKRILKATDSILKAGMS